MVEVGYSEIHGYLPDAFQSNLPPSTITPPIAVPCPPMNFVAECTTMFACIQSDGSGGSVAKVELLRVEGHAYGSNCCNLQYQLHLN